MDKPIAKLKLLTTKGEVVDAILYCHQETTTIGGTTYYLLKLDTPADTSGLTLSVSTGSVARVVWGKFVFQLTGIAKILVSTIYATYRAYTGGGTVNAEIDILILKADGTVRTTIATGVSKSNNLGSSWATYTGASYSFAEYTVVAQTDCLEIDYIANVTSKKSGQYAYLRIDDNTLALDNQTRSQEWSFEAGTISVYTSFSFVFRLSGIVSQIFSFSFLIRTLTSSLLSLKYKLKELKSNIFSSLYPLKSLVSSMFSSLFSYVAPLTSVYKIFSSLHRLGQRIVSDFSENLHKFYVVDLVSRLIKEVSSLLQRVSRPFVLLHSLKIFISSVSLSIYSLRSIVSKMFHTLHNIRLSIYKFFTSLYQIISITAVTSFLTLRYGLSGLTRRIMTSIYSVGFFISKFLTSIFSLRVFRTKAFSFQHNVRKLLANIFRVFYWVRLRLSGMISLRYSMKALVSSIFRVVFSLRSNIGRMLSILYNILNRTSRFLSTKFNIKVLASRILTGLNSLAGFIARILTAKFNLRTILSVVKVIKFNILSIVNRINSLSYSLRQAIFSIFKNIYGLGGFISKKLSLFYYIGRAYLESIFKVIAIKSTFQVQKTLSSFKVVAIKSLFEVQKTLSSFKTIVTKAKSILLKFLKREKA